MNNSPENIFEKAFDKIGREIRPIFHVDYACGGLCGGALAVLAFRHQYKRHVRARIFIPKDSTPKEGARILRDIADQLEAEEGKSIRCGDDLFDDLP